MVFSKSFLSHRTEKISPGNHSVFHKNFGGEENFMDGRGWGYHDFPSEMLCLTLPKLLHWRKIFCFKKIFNSKIFMHTRGGITILSKNFVLQDRNEKFCKGTLLFSRKTLVTKNFNCDRGYHVFPSEIFGVTVPKNFVGIPSMFQKLCGIVKFYASETEGVSRFSLENFCHTLPKNVIAEQFGVSEKFVYRKILCIRRRYH